VDIINYTLTEGKGIRQCALCWTRTTLRMRFKALLADAQNSSKKIREAE